MALRTTDSNGSILSPTGSADSGIAVVVDAESSSEIILPSGQFLSDAAYLQQGDDLVLISPDGATFIIRGYYLLDNPPDLITAEGGRMTAALVESFIISETAGQYAQTGEQLAQAAQPIGQVKDLTGQAFAVRVDGTRVALAAGDPVFQGDVIETGDGGAVNLLFLDETTFALGDSARLALDEMVYNPATQQGQSSFSILKGVFVFVSGQIAQTDNTKMTVTTPVATIGIRGTTVAGDVRPAGEESKFTVVDGEIAIITQGGSVLMSDQNATTIVTSFTAPPSEPVVLTQSQVNANYGSAGNVSGGSLGGPEDVSPEAGGGEGNVVGGGGSFVSVTRGEFAVFDENGDLKDPEGEGEGEGDFGSEVAEEESASDDDDDAEAEGEGEGEGEAEEEEEEELGEGEGEGDGVNTIDFSASPDPVDVTGGEGADVIIGSNFDDNIDGSDGNDVLTGGSGNDTVLGGLGDDTIIAANGEGDDFYDGGDGFDIAIYTSSPNGVSINLTNNFAFGDGFVGNDDLVNIEGIFTGVGNDTITGDGADNILFGGAGNDVIQGIGGANLIAGEAGDDRLFGGSGDDAIDGGDGNDTLDGGGGNDILAAGAGNDLIIGSLGDDFIDGGAGFNTLRYDIAGVQIDFSQGTVSGAGFLDTFVNINQAFVTVGNVNVIGSDIDEVFTGGNGNDTIDGGGGNDTLDGGLGADIILGGAGNDVITFDAADATLDGGTGNDALFVTAPGSSIDFTGASRPVSFEFVELDGGSSTVFVESDDILNNTDNGTLTVIGDSSNILASDTPWVNAGTVTIEESTFAQFTFNGATLLLDTQMVPTSTNLSFVGGVDNIWSTGGNWSPAFTPPADGDSAFLGSGATVIYDLTAGTAGVTLLDTLSGNDALAVNSGTVTVDNQSIYDGDIFLNGGGFGGNGLFIANGGFTTSGGPIDIVGTGGITVEGSMSLGGNISLASVLTGSGFQSLEDGLNITGAGGSLTTLNDNITTAFDATANIGTSFANAGDFEVESADVTTDGFTNVATGSIFVDLSGTGSTSRLASTGGLTNDGFIDLFASTGGTSVGTATLDVTGGALFNSSTGTINVETDPLGSAVFLAQLSNQGTVQVRGLDTSTFNFDGAGNSNTGLFDVGAETIFNLDPGEIFANSSNMTIASSTSLITLTVNGGVFEQNTGGEIVFGDNEAFNFVNGNLDLNGGVFTANAGPAAVGLTGSTLNVNNDFILDTNFTVLMGLNTDIVNGAVFTNNGTLFTGADVTHSGGVLDSKDGALEVLAGSTLTVDNGTVVVGNDTQLLGTGEIRITSNSSIEIAAGETFDLDSGTTDIILDDGATIGGAGSAVNTGLFDVLNETLTIDLANFDNVAGGTVSIIDSVVDFNGVFSNAAGGTVDVQRQSALTTVDFANSFTNEGIINLNGAGTSQVQFIMGAGATLTNAGTLASSEGFIQTFGAISNAASGLILQDTSNPSFDTWFFDTDLTNAGTVHITQAGTSTLNSFFNVGENTTLTNQATGTLLFDGGGGNQYDFLGNFDNQGLVSVNTANDVVFRSGAANGTVTVVNSGTIDVATGNNLEMGNANLATSFFNNTGTVNVGAGGTLSLLENTVNFNAGTSFQMGTGASLVIEENSVLNLNVDHTNLSGRTILQDTGGTLAGTGTLTNQGNLDSNNGTLSIDNTVVNEANGLIDLAGASTLTGSGTILNQAASDITLQDDTINLTLVHGAAATGTMFLAGNVDITNTLIFESGSTVDTDFLGNFTTTGLGVIDNSTALDLNFDEISISSVVNRSGGVIDLQGGTVSQISADIFDNLAGATLVASTAQSSVSMNSGPLRSSGLISVSGTGDTLSLLNTDLELSGVLDIATGAEADFVGNSTLMIKAGGTLTGDGVVTIASVLDVDTGVNFQLGAADPTINFAAPFTNGNLSGAGTFSNGGNVNFVASNTNGISVDNFINESGGTLSFSDSAFSISSTNFTNNAGATFLMDATPGVVSATFAQSWTNNGLLHLTSDTDLNTTFLSFGAANTMTNSATGTILVDGATDLTSHQLTGNVQNDGLATVAAGNFAFGGSGTFTNSGTIDVVAPGAILGVLASGSEYINQAGGTINLNTGSMQTDFGTITNDGLLNMGTGALNIASNSLFLQNSDLTIGNGAVARVGFGNSGGTLDGTGTVTVQSGGTIDLQGGGVLEVDVVVNQGNLLSNNDTLTINGLVRNENFIDLAGSTTLTGTGAIINQGPTDITLQDETIDLTFTQAAAATGTMFLAGTLDIGGSLIFDTGSIIDTDFFGNVVTGGAGTIDNSTTLDLGFDELATLHITNRNGGVINLNSGTVSQITTALLDNEAGGTINANNFQSNIDLSGGGVLQNAGLIDVTGSGDILTIVNGEVQNSSTIGVATGGTLDISGGTLSMLAGGTLVGDGVVNFASALNIDSGVNYTLGAADPSMEFTNGDIIGAGTFTNDGDVTLTTGGDISVSRFDNTGNFNFEVGVFGVGSGVLFSNAVGGTMVLDATNGASSSFLQLQSDFSNQGLINLTSDQNAGHGVLRFEGQRFTNAGTLLVDGTSTAASNMFGDVLVNTGLLDIDSPQTFQLGVLSITNTVTGTINVGDGRRLGIDQNIGFTDVLINEAGGTINLNNTGDFFILNQADVTNDGVLAIGGGTLNISGNSVFSQNSDLTLANAGALIAVGNTGTLDGTGTVTVQNGTTLALNDGGLLAIDTVNNGLVSTNNNTYNIDSNLTLNVGSSFDLSGAKFIFGTGVVDNQAGNVTLDADTIGAGATFLQSAATATLGAGVTVDGTLSSVGTGIIVASGTNDVSGTGVLNIENSATFTSATNLNIAVSTLTVGASGSVLFDGDLDIDSTDVDFAAGATATFVNGDGGSNFDVGVGGTLTNDGTLEIGNGGRFNTANGTYVNTAGGEITVDDFGEINVGAGTFSNFGSISLGGGTNVATISTNLGGTFRNEATGTLVSTAGSNVSISLGAGDVNSGNLGFMQFNDTVQFNFAAGTIFRNDGVMDINGGEGAFILDGAGDFINNVGGVITVESTTVTAQNGFDTITNNGSLTFGTSPGTLTIDGGIANGSTAFMEFELGGLAAGIHEGYDQMTVAGTMVAGGTLNVVEFGGFDVGAGDSFTIVQAGTLGDSFDEITGLEVGDGVVLDATQSASAITLTGKSITHQGTASGETLTGSIGDDVIVAGAGDDVVIGGGGADLVHAGDGDDIFVAADTGFGRFDGGGGTDLVSFGGAGQSFDLTGLRGDQLSGIERIDFGGFGDNVLTLNADIAFAATGNENTLTGAAHSLVIDGDTGDSLNALGDWSNTGTVTIDGNGYSIYQSATNDAQVFVDDDIAVSAA